MTLKTGAKAVNPHHHQHETGQTDSVAVTHAQLGGITTDQHHSKLHGVEHEAGGTDPVVLDAPDHDHTGTGDGGTLHGVDISTFVVFEEQSGDPATPGANKARIYAKDDGAGHTELYYENSDGTVRDLSASATGLSAHNHTSGSGDGGILTGDEHDGFSEYLEIATPSNPAASKHRIYFKTDGSPYTLNTAGVEAVLGSGGGGGGSSPFTPPVLTNFTATNQGSATATQVGDMVWLTVPSSDGSSDHHLWDEAVPGSTPWYKEVAFDPVWDGNGSLAAIIMRESSTGKFVRFLIGVSGDNVIYLIDKWTNATTYSGGQYVAGRTYIQGPPYWLRVGNDGTNRKCFIGREGNWIEIHSVGNTDFCTPNRVGVALSGGGVGRVQGTIWRHWA